MVFKSVLGTIGAKLEDNYGVEKAPAASELFLARDIVVNPVGDKIERPFQHSSLSTMKHMISLQRQEVTFTTEIRGDGSEISPLLEALGFLKATKVYTPATASLKSVTIHAYFDGILHKILGAVGVKAEVVLEAGQPGLIKWTFNGLYKRPIDIAMVAGTNYESDMPPIVRSSNFKIGTYAAIIQALNVNVDNGVAQRPNVSASFGIEGFAITSRKITGSMNPETVLESVHTFWENWEEGNSEALEITVGNVSGNKYKITAPVCVKDSVAFGDRDGVRIYEIPFSLHMSTGNDELQIEFL